MSANLIQPDVFCAILRLFVYPIKSCAGVEVQEAILTETGLEFDRAWMVVRCGRVWARFASVVG